MVCICSVSCIYLYFTDIVICKLLILWNPCNTQSTLKPLNCFCKFWIIFNYRHTHYHDVIFLSDFKVVFIASFPSLSLNYDHHMGSNNIQGRSTQWWWIHSSLFNKSYFYSASTIFEDEFVIDEIPFWVASKNGIMYESSKNC